MKDEGVYGLEQKRGYLGYRSAVADLWLLRKSKPRSIRPMMLCLVAVDESVRAQVFGRRDDGTSTR